MRLILTAVTAAAALGAWGCKPPPKEQIEDRLKRDIHLQFNNLNNEAQARKENLRKEQEAALRNPALPTPTGTIYSTYQWDVDGYIAENFECQVCKTRQLLVVPSSEYLCKSCGHCPYKMHSFATPAAKRESPCKSCLDAPPQYNKVKEPGDMASEEALKKFEGDGAKIKKMYEVTSHDPEKGIIKATVRYVRRTWSYDGRGAVPVNDKIIVKAAVDAKWFPTEGAEGVSATDPQTRYTRPGFHRQDTVWVGEMGLEYRGTTMTELWRKDEVSVRPWKDIRPSR